MSSKLLKIKLHSIENQGPKRESESSLWIKVGEQQNLINVRLSKGKRKVYSRELSRQILELPIAKSPQSLPLEVKASHKGAIYPDPGKSSAIWTLRPKMNKRERFSMEVRIPGKDQKEDRFIVTFKAELSEYQKLIPARELRSLLRDKLGSRLFESARILLTDPIYHLPARDDLQRYVSRSKADQGQGKALGMDVDDYALRMKAEFMERSYSKHDLRQALAVGIVWGREMHTGKRALLFALTEKSELLFIDPMDKSIFAPRGDDRKIFLLYA